MEVSIDIFEGPLDLLLYLVRKLKVSIYDIPIAKITDEYLSYIEKAKELKIELAGEFFVMASTLMYIKSRSLLPSGEEEESEDTLKEELIQKLAEYERYKNISQQIGELLDSQKDVFYRGKPVFPDSDISLSITIFDLMKAFQELLEKVPQEILQLIYEEVPIEEKIRHILTVVSEREKISFQELASMEKTRIAIVTLFLALLELIRLNQIIAEQNKPFEKILISKTAENAT